MHDGLSTLGQALATQRGAFSELDSSRNGARAVIAAESDSGSVWSEWSYGLPPYGLFVGRRADR